MYKFKLNKNTDHDDLSVNGHNLRKDKWSEALSNKPLELMSELRTRANLDGIIDCKYYSDTDESIVYFESERDCDTNIVLYHKSEFASIPRSEQLILAEMYNIKHAPYMPPHILHDHLLEAQTKFEERLMNDGVDLESNFSKMRTYINRKED